MDFEFPVEAIPRPGNVHVDSRRSAWPKFLFAGSVIFLLGSLAGLRLQSSEWIRPQAVLARETGLPEVANGWSATHFGDLPEPACAFLADPKSGRMYIGTVGDANVFYIAEGYNDPTPLPIAMGLGDLLRFGSAEVSSLALVDINGDGRLHLIAQTSQARPQGHPKLFAWSFYPYPELVGFAQPEIASSWSHGLATVLPRKGKAPSLLSTHCGYGEVVEYRLDNLQTNDGRKVTAFGWEKVANLPASGESIKVVPGDPDAQEVCIAVGYSPRKAELRFYRSPNAENNSKNIAKDTTSFNSADRSWQLVDTIDEGQRFANVRFAVANMEGDSVRDVVAFWSLDLTGGPCEVIRYRIDHGGHRTRLPLMCGSTHDMWPLENQIAIVDVERQGRPAIWFASGSGNLWRHSGKPGEAAKRILRVPEGLGPVAAFGDNGLLVGSQNTILRIQPSTAVVAR